MSNNRIFHLVYLTLNLINKKFYVGVHSTDNCNDNYLGSGTILKQAIITYSESNFQRKILFYCLSAQDAYEIETRIVNEDFIKRLDTYNIVLGGSGGKRTTSGRGAFKNKNIEEMQEIYNKISKSNKGKPALYMIGENNPSVRFPEKNPFNNPLIQEQIKLKRIGTTYSEEAKRNMSKGAIERYIKNPPVTGWKHSKETIDKLKLAKKYLICPHCNKNVPSTHNKYHFENCKYKDLL
jgi:hypothetical protein